ncbi:hypothetical protein VY88_08420 [Azospirillum thiophilum]|uniref:Uncharacterized protein n=1 Tax=Azospirillum thiophilum TaxID=528244 RepID=A0AAC8VVQ7_9PROT|nr:hypothetical protein [Azospirillum thiophilum]ALG70261.1 hypothetical protein AL072_04285 [Azospirillum thiophilum]KJR66062.1 hypothetical protein VY88_08420 [Azospirillum thiophilum]
MNSEKPNTDPVANELVTKGAFALYHAENAHRVAEFKKSKNAEAAIAADFDAYRSRYLRKFRDVFDSLSEQGLTVTRAV